MEKESLPRRKFIKNTLLGALVPGALTSILGSSSAVAAPFFNEAKKDNSTLKVTGVKLHRIQVNHRGNWYFIELQTNKGITGIGECSHGVTGLQTGDDEKVEIELKKIFALVKEESPYAIEQFRQRGFLIATNKVSKTVLSGVEQALWDICGKASELPSYQFWGGKVRNELNVYANINRATKEKDASGRRLASAFQRTAALAVSEGFRAIKMAPFDEMLALDKSTPVRIKEDIDHAVNCVYKVRETIGKDVQLLVDVHSHLNEELSIEVAKQLEAANLYWYEEPIDPNSYYDETARIKKSIQQPLAGGEAIFRREGFVELIRQNALDILMPDVKHCGGLLELKYIAAMGEAFNNLKVAPHNPSGPVATIATKAICASLTNFSIIEYAFGEVPWSKDLITPTEVFSNGTIKISDLPGLGHSLNLKVLQEHSY